MLAWNQGNPTIQPQWVYSWGLWFSRGPTVSERPFRHYLIRKHRSRRSWKLPYRTSRCPASLNAQANAIFCCTRIGVPTPVIYLINKRNKSLNSLVAQV
jgi:hypothetical protein